MFKNGFKLSPYQLNSVRIGPNQYVWAKLCQFEL